MFSNRRLLKRVGLCFGAAGLLLASLAVAQTESNRSENGCIVLVNVPQQVEILKGRK